MPNFFQKLKNNLSGSNKSHSNSNSPNNDQKKNETKNSSNKSQNPTLSTDSHLKNSSNISDNKQEQNKNLNLLGLIIDSSILMEDNNLNEPANSKSPKSKKPTDQTFNIFDPDDIPDETETFNKTSVNLICFNLFRQLT